MAQTSSKRRCAFCNTPAGKTQKYCSQCGAALPPTPAHGNGSRRAPRLLIGFVLAGAVIVLASRLVSLPDDRTPTTTAQQTTGRALATQPAATNTPKRLVSADWAASLPAGAKLGTVETIFDGDTFDLTVNGITSRYRLYRADTPETYDPVECGGYEATAFVRTTLGQSDTPNQVWVESVGQLDPYGRTLAYLWLTIDGQPYLLNYLLINNGWAENKSYGDAFDPYRAELGAAASYAYTNSLGVWGACGDFGVPLGAKLTDSSRQLELQPTTFTGAALGGNCHPSYIPCVPISPVDLDCRDVGFQVEVIGFDEYRLDNDDPDLIGCETW